ncbi:DUF1573 domain-containing protein, partial [Odoribacter sp. OttesenSCG-928-A06]|nr:DUF1573 domain-containing protein [Odoribacter sp. OttesenSCG-928-A06]
TKLPAHLKIAVEPTQIPVKGTAVFNVEYNTTLHGAFGLNTENVLMSVDGKNYPLPVSIFIEEDFSRVNATEAPAIQVEKRYHNFGTIVAGQKYAHRYQLTNTGQSVLKIHRCYSSDENVSLSLLKNELAPGESTELIAEINQITKPGKISASISVISNSPLNSEMKLRFYGDLK